jgi:hypothetical protein
MAITLPISRFTDDELLAITTIAAPRIDTGLWSGLERDSGADFDHVSIWLPYNTESYYKICRDPKGWTDLLFCTSDSCRLIVSGSLEECLMQFKR